ncbi:MAG: nucleotidyl transferase AbiEii/AbiGii toxin family protein [Candidatus Obscuribacterales bacterium]|nr:nucleotidyl transferase AbiEii/AbiGii toxin family protein [Candidatus Obscuribacterales bacterium]
MSIDAYRKQVSLLMRILPIVAQEQCFALKGGTAINLFVRDMPRLSVDIDLAYLSLLDREESLGEIDASLKRIASELGQRISGSRVQASVLPGTSSVVKLIVNTVDAQVKIEVTPVLRGTVYSCQTLATTDKVQEEFGFAKVNVVSFADLYGGKLVAALDRQHPRDLFDVRLLLAAEGISRELFEAFLVYLISHNRPMSEIISPKFKDIRREFERGFTGMTTEAVSLADLEETREQLVIAIRSSFLDSDRRFLLSMKNGNPDWSLLAVEDVEQLPAVRWKLRNLENMDKDKRAALYKQLEIVLAMKN